MTAAPAPLNGGAAGRGGARATQAAAPEGGRPPGERPLPRLLRRGERPLARTCSAPVIGDAALVTGSDSARSTRSLPLDVEVGPRPTLEPPCLGRGQRALSSASGEPADGEAKQRPCRRGAAARRRGGAEQGRSGELALSLVEWAASPRPGLAQLVSLAEACFGSGAGGGPAGAGQNPAVLASLDQVSRHIFSLVHVKSTSKSNRQPFADTSLDSAQLASLQRIMPKSFCSTAPLELARQQIVLLILVVAAQDDTANAAPLLTTPRSRSVTESLRRALEPVADGGGTCSADSLRLMMNFLSELRVSIIKVLASSLMRGRGGNSKFQQHAMSAQQACMALLCGTDPGEGDIEKRMGILHRLAQNQPVLLAKNGPRACCGRS
ncbi:unnamed protein product [Prorocentrum cordatum]|uniref:Uncharacterized protein n=1 Tax=Prorocentrum cordatum TaxID=2364126 RepID=A0ABN9WZ20_9DINO|nr:unnamed protein product [Polarella glacialis]